MLRIENLNFHYQADIQILSDINFIAQKGEIVSILGESGSGKSSLLRLIYGLEDAASGKIYYKQKPVTGPKFNLVPGHPKMKFVPQEFDLLNPVTVSENVGKYLSNFNLPLKKESIENALDVVGLRKQGNHFPSELSGGQRQRVAIARALAAEPEVLLLDEPYSHLDQPLKFEIRRSIYNWAKENEATMLITTHDAQDALGFSDKLCIIREGKIIQMNTPKNVNEFPQNEYVAGMLGHYFTLNHQEISEIFQTEIPSDKKALIYPEELTEDLNGEIFQVSDIRFQGNNYLVEAKINEVKVLFYSENAPEGNSVRLKIKRYRLVPK